MKLHYDIPFFSELIKTASHNLPVPIKAEFIEKDYWITLALHRLAISKYADEAVFKGGTSLSKGYNLINRFSEDVDIAIINRENNSGNEIKNIIRAIEKKMSAEMNEIKAEGITSKGSRFRKSVFEYKSFDKENKYNKLIVEVNSFANPIPFQPLAIKSFVYDFLIQTKNEKIVDQYDLQPFTVNVLNKEQTLMEKLVSLIRFSFEENAANAMAKKVRHFYDLYFLIKDKECLQFIHSLSFKKRFTEILNHDRELFDEPIDWQSKQISQSPLLNDFENLWKQLRSIYSAELSLLAFAEIPSEKMITKSFTQLAKLIQ